MSNINLSSLISHGKVNTTIRDNNLELSTDNSITSIAYNLTGNTYKRHYVEIPQKVHIPFTITLNLKLDYSGLIILIGNGHILFNCPSNKKIEDIIKPLGKSFPSESLFANKLTTDIFHQITISYGYKEMQVLVDNKEAFYTDKLPYMHGLRR